MCAKGRLFLAEVVWSSLCRMCSRFVVGAGVKVVQRSSQVYTKEEKGKKGKRGGNWMGGEGDEAAKKKRRVTWAPELEIRTHSLGSVALPSREKDEERWGSGSSGGNEYYASRDPRLNRR